MSRVHEPKIVVEHREHLWYLLAEAAQLEHMIMCQYLYAEFTLKRDVDEGLTEEQFAAVTRWRAVLRDIAVEEMSHLALVANLMTSIGAAPPFGRPNFPQRSGHFPAGIQLDLLPFGEEALEHFLYLERPEGMARLDADEFVPMAPSRRLVEQNEIFPRGQEFATVGHLYRGIADGLRTLSARCGERALFVGPARAQATPKLFRWPELIAVTDLASAIAAVDQIIEQGEGACGDWRTAHYGRFLEVWHEYTAMRAADPDFEPARPALCAFSRQPYDRRDPAVLIGDPDSLAVAEVFNLGYEVLLHTLLRFFTHTDETDEQLEVLVDSLITLMAGVVGPVGTMLTAMPVGPDHPGRNVGPAFEMFYVMTNLVPWREAAWTLLAERAGILADRCRLTGGRVPGLAGAADAARTVADRLAEHARR